MEIVLPDGCGNAPRIGIVADFVANWAREDIAAIAGWLADDVIWNVVGGDSHRGPEAAAGVTSPFPPERLVLRAIVTHGRLAACDGYLEAGTQRLTFSHSFRFSGAAKTAKIAEIRSFLV